MASKAVAPGWVRATRACAASTELQLLAIDSSHSPRRVKMCDGMWRACAASGAIPA